MADEWYVFSIYGPDENGVPTGPAGYRAVKKWPAGTMLKVRTTKITNKVGGKQLYVSYDVSKGHGSWVADIGLVEGEERILALGRSSHPVISVWSILLPDEFPYQAAGDSHNGPVNHLNFKDGSDIVQINVSLILPAD